MKSPSDRIPCCIDGCRRTFKSDHAGGATELMCGKHWRAVGKRLPEVKARQLRYKRLLRRMKHKFPDIWDPDWHKQFKFAVFVAGPRPRRLVHFMVKRCNEAWATLKAEAQRLQDQGYFAPRPRGKRASKKGQKIIDPHAARFEDQFQRLKRSMR